MKIAIVLTLQICIIAGLIYFFHQPTQQNKEHFSAPLCLQTNGSHRLCAECFKRDRSLHKNKGYQVIGNGPTSVLKIANNQELVNCSEFLQMIDFNRDSSAGQ